MLRITKVLNDYWKQSNQQLKILYGTSWRLARHRKQSHGISHLRAKYLKDRYSIHQLTNIQFLKELASNYSQYKLRINEKIILLAQMQHIYKLLKKNRQHTHQFSMLTLIILKELKDPQDLPCVGTFIMTLISMGQYDRYMFRYIMDCLIARKYDEDYDELFGIVYGLYRYRCYHHQYSDYANLTNDEVLPLISVIYRNSLNTLMQFIKYNLYNHRECHLILIALYAEKINQGYFWQAVGSWFNIYIKEQLMVKPVEDYFIMKEGSVERVLYDDGMIRVRPIMVELGAIAYVLIQNGIVSKRFMKLFQDVVLYTMQNGKQIYDKYLSMQRDKQQQSNSQPQIKINQHFNTKKQVQLQQIKLMEAAYKLIFCNPIDINNGDIIKIMVVFAKYNKTIKQIKQKQPKQQSNHINTNLQFMDFNYNVIKWIWVRLCKKQMKYNIQQLLQIVQYAGNIFQLSQTQLRQLFILRLKQNLRELNCSYYHLQQLLFYLPMMQFDQLGKILQHFLLKSHPKQILKLTQMIEKQQWVRYLPSYFLKLPTIVNFHQKYYSFEQNCYYLYILLKNKIYWETKITSQYQGQMEILKQCVKITTYSRGFKLKMDSYFHKLLEYIDLVQFFEGGK